jgi:hypothetical protein
MTGDLILDTCILFDVDLHWNYTMLIICTVNTLAGRHLYLTIEMSLLMPTVQLSSVSMLNVVISARSLYSCSIGMQSQLSLIYLEWSSSVSNVSCAYIQSTVARIQFVDINSRGKLIGAVGNILSM